MPFRDLLKKRDKLANEDRTPTRSNSDSNSRTAPPLPPPRLSPSVPEFQFLRTTTTTEEKIEPPSFPGDPMRYDKPLLSPDLHSRFGRFKSKSSAGAASAGTGAGWQQSLPGDQGPGNASTNTHGKGKLAERLHFGRGRSASSINVPDHLPDVGGDGVARTEEEEAKWETRATVLVTEGLAHGPGGPSPPGTPSFDPADLGAVRLGSATERKGSVGTRQDEVRLGSVAREGFCWRDVVLMVWSRWIYKRRYGCMKKEVGTRRVVMEGGGGVVQARE